ncbi:hypothetical protein QZH41_014079 [Actinostola sp. cb2023]|nr:hypothetical protein QZH41_014079 [Actinostola sp. cb2023]
MSKEYAFPSLDKITDETKKKLISEHKKTDVGAAVESRTYDYKDVQDLFNQKYSIAMGKALKVPYEKGGFVVNHLPQGIEFKKPSSYGKKQIESIMVARDKIKFVILDETTAITDPKSSYG